VHQAGNVLHRHRQVAQDLQHGDGLGDVLVQLRVWKTNLNLADRLMDGGECAADVLFQFVVQRNGGGQPPHRLIGHGFGTAFAFQDILDHFDRRAQTYAAGRLG